MRLLGLLTPDQAQQLKDCGVDKVNHNLNTGEEHYADICTTHTYADRVATLQAVRNAGMQLCSGGIIGMGERDRDIVQMAMHLRELGVESIPVNFLNPIDGTPLAGREDLNPRYCLKVLAMFRFVNPSRQLRIAGGREMHLGSLQPLGLYVANSLFVGDYLTTNLWSPNCGVSSWRGGAVMLLMAKFRTQWAALFVAVTVVAAFYASWFAFARAHLLLDAATPALALIVIFASGALMRLSEISAARAGLRLAFSDCCRAPV